MNPRLRMLRSLPKNAASVIVPPLRGLWSSFLAIGVGWVNICCKEFVTLAADDLKLHQILGFAKLAADIVYILLACFHGSFNQLSVFCIS